MLNWCPLSRGKYRIPLISFCNSTRIYLGLKNGSIAGSARKSVPVTSTATPFLNIPIRLGSGFRPMRKSVSPSSGLGSVGNGLVVGFVVVVVGAAVVVRSFSQSMLRIFPLKTEKEYKPNLSVTFHIIAFNLLKWRRG